MLWRLGDSPLASSIHVVPNQFLLLRVYVNHRTTRGQRTAHLRVNVLKLCVLVWMVLAFFGLAVPLQAVIHPSKELRHLFMTDRMLFPRELLGQRARALARPSQGGFRIPSGQGFDERL